MQHNRPNANSKYLIKKKGWSRVVQVEIALFSPFEDAWQILVDQLLVVRLQSFNIWNIVICFRVEVIFTVNM